MLEPTPAAKPTRMLSVDALRGFDMFWIIGGEHVAKALDPLSDGPILSSITAQLQHVEWEGFRFYDCIFPLFLFLVGVSIVLSLDRLLTTVGQGRALIRVLTRSCLLFIVGVFYYGGLARGWPDIQLSGVLPRIALCYLIAALLVIYLPRKAVVAAAIACLVVYWALMAWMPFPDVDLKHGTLGKKGSQSEAKSVDEMLAGVTNNIQGKYEEGRNLAHYVDFRYLPGKKRNLYYTNEGLLSTIPSVATTLLGVMAGWILTSATWSDRKKVVWLLIGGAVLVGIGWAWSFEFPIIKRIWTSSFALVAGGCSAMLMGLFYLVVDVWRLQKWCVPLLWIGSNALAVYLAENLIDFKAIAERFVGGDVSAALDTAIKPGIGALLVAIVTLLLPILLLRFLYSRKIFIRL